MRPYPKYLDWLRYTCAWLLYFYGIAKLAGHQLTLPASFAEQPIGTLCGYNLTWYYFGYSHAYSDILGIIQVVSATLLLFRRTTLFAAMVMLPVMANIVMINLFFWIGLEQWAHLASSLSLLFSYCGAREEPFKFSSGRISPLKPEAQRSIGLLVL